MLKFQPSFNDGILLQEKGETVNGFMPSKSVDTGWTDLCFISRWKGERNHTWESYEASWDRRLLEPSVIDENVSWISLFIGDWCTSSRQAGKISHHFIKNGWTFSNHFLRLNSGSIVSESLADFFFLKYPLWQCIWKLPKVFFFSPFWNCNPETGWVFKISLLTTDSNHYKWASRRVTYIHSTNSEYAKHW